MNPVVLVIEDNEQNLYLIRFLLEKNGFNVIEADLIVLDIQLPKMDGYAVARELRKNGELAGTSIVAVTSYAMVGDRERVLAAGADGYIEKPIDPDTFIAKIEQHLPIGMKGA